MALALLGLIANWRMGGAAEVLFGCRPMGGDTRPHKFSCLPALAVIRGALFCTPGWAVVEQFEAAICLVPVSMSVTAHFVVWGSVVHRVYVDVWHRGRPVDASSSRRNSFARNAPSNQAKSVPYSRKTQGWMDVAQEREGPV